VSALTNLSLNILDVTKFEHWLGHPNGIVFHYRLDGMVFFQEFGGNGVFYHVWPQGGQYS
jgi:hypothetical protein